jgi:hypothetical protein
MEKLKAGQGETPALCVTCAQQPRWRGRTQCEKCDEIWRRAEEFSPAEIRAEMRRAGVPCR